MKPASLIKFLECTGEKKRIYLGESCNHSGCMCLKMYTPLAKQLQWYELCPITDCDSSNYVFTLSLLYTKIKGKLCKLYAFSTAR